MKIKAFKISESGTAREVVIIVLCVTILIAAALYSLRLETKHQVIFEPTFTGEVIEAYVRNIFTPGMHRPQQIHRWHIIGEFMDGDQVIHIDGTFTIPRSLYYRHPTGSILSHETLSAC